MQVTRSVRIDKAVDEEMRKLAEEQRMSVNLLANRALRRFVEWDAYGDKFGFTSMPGDLFARMMDGLSDEEAIELGHWVGENLIREFVMFWFKDAALEKVVEAFPRLFAKYGRSFDYEEKVDGPVHTAILKHNRGMRWSLYYQEIVRTAFKDILTAPVKTEPTENQLVFRFLMP